MGYLFMIIQFKKNESKENIDRVKNYLKQFKVEVVDASSENVGLYGVVGDTSTIDETIISALPGVESVTRIAAPYKKVSRAFHPTDTIVEVNGIKIGGKEKIALIAGPCSVESEEQLLEIAEAVKDAGATMLRGGAYKPRTSPYVFQGLGTVGIEILKEAREKYSLPIVTEIMSVEKIDEFVENVDIIQVGARNMQNFDLLKALGKIDKPVLLKRGLSNTIEEWLMSAEYIMAGGNNKVILCERGIRTFEKMTRNTLDLSVIPLIKKLTHLPIVIDPSHATGHYDLVEPMSLAAIAAGADGLIIEVHNCPEKALSDGAQSLKPKRFKALVEKGKVIAKVIGRDL